MLNAGKRVCLIRTDLIILLVNIKNIFEHTVFGKIRIYSFRAVVVAVQVGNARLGSVVYRNTNSGAPGLIDNTTIITKRKDEIEKNEKQNNTYK